LVNLARVVEADSAFREANIKKFRTKIRIYWSDCDAAGIAYYGNFFRFFEMGEEELFYSLGQSRPEIYRKHQIGFPRVETWCRYHKPARLGDLLEITVWIGRRSLRSIQFCFELRRDGELDLVAEGNYSLVCVNREFQPVPLPGDLLRLLGDYLPPASERTASD
jgi:acyl-CoA thioester hydrolase